MNIKVGRRFSRVEVQRQFDQEVSRFLLVLRLELDRVALETLTLARQKGPDQGGFNDQTGNLRSSMGYIIMHNGKQLSNDFKTYGKGSSGKRIGEKIAGEVAKKYKKGWAIIMVAGMEYATWVESKGRDVMTGSTLDMEGKIKDAWESAKRATRRQ